MLDMNMIKSVVHSIFQGSGKSVLSKSDILSKVAQSGAAAKFLPFFKQLSDKPDHTESSVTSELQNIAGGQGGQSGQEGGVGGAVSKIRSKVGV